jgi:hypothetical protein
MLTYADVCIYIVERVACARQESARHVYIYIYIYTYIYIYVYVCTYVYIYKSARIDVSRIVIRHYWEMPELLSHSDALVASSIQVSSSVVKHLQSSDKAVVKQ